MTNGEGVTQTAKKQKAAEHCRSPQRGRHCERIYTLAFWSAAALRRFRLGGIE